MKIAALYDVHGNLPALEAVLRAAEREGVDEIVVGGDVVPGPMPEACLDRLLECSTPRRFIQGNGEVDVVAFGRGGAPARVPEAFHEAMRWVAEELRGEPLETIASWPATVRSDVPGLGAVLFCHAAPRDDNEIFTRLTPEERLRPIFEAAGAEAVLCGHTHMQFDRWVGETRVVNAGSVGMPFGEPGAFWALVEPTGVELRRTEYDLDAATARLRATGYPGVEQLRLIDPPSEGHMLGVFEAAALRR